MNTISVGIDKILNAFAGKNEDGGLRIYTNSINAYSKAGQKANFKCSHTLFYGGKQGYNRIIAGELKRKM